MTLSPSALVEDGTLPADPTALLADWLPANDDPARTLMTLGTLDADGLPNARTVLLSEFDAEGFAFHTDSRSAKVAEVTANPVASLTMVWPGRQLVVQGTVAPTTPEQDAAVYARRSRYLQLLAWLNTDEFAALPLDERLAAWAAYADTHPLGTLAPPTTWVGFTVRPLRLAFWEGRPETAGIRTTYTRTPTTAWTTTTLAG